MVDSHPPGLPALQRVIASILDARRPARSLQQEVQALTRILARAGTARHPGPAQALAAETRTANGLALSPAMAALCAQDVARTVEFLRGTHAAILHVRKREPARPVRILYAGCGPYATLAVPLMAALAPGEACFTLLDIHPASIASARSIVDTLGLAEYVADCAAMDAAAYRVCPEQPPDILLLELMQACLESEPQVAITRHLVAQAPGALLVPEEVRVDLVLVDTASVCARPPHEGATLQRGQITVAPVFAVCRERVAAWEDVAGSRLPGAVARLPDPVAPGYQPMLSTSIRVYGDHVLQDDDSGLTCPRVLSADRPARAGDVLAFHYALGPHPRLHAQVQAGAPASPSTRG